jgi:hypothetical protein
LILRSMIGGTAMICAVRSQAALADVEISDLGAGDGN